MLAGVHPHYFNRIDKEVINLHQDAMEDGWLRLLPPVCACGSSTRSISQWILSIASSNEKRASFNVAIQWRDYVDQLRRNRTLTGPSIQQLNELQKRDFVDVDL
jgi:hypothetical protein